MGLFGWFKKSEGSTGPGATTGSGGAGSAAASPWRAVIRSDADTADVLAYATGLVEGRLAGKYMLSSAQYKDTVVVLGVKARGIVSGADVQVDNEAAARHGMEIARQARSGRSTLSPIGTVSYAEMTGGASDKFEARPVDLEQPAVLLYTSGTTGQPKGVMLSHRNFISQCRDVVPSVMEMRPTDRIVMVLPLFHVYALSNGLVTATFNGSGMVLVPQYTPAWLLGAIERSEATLLIAIPSMYQHILQYARVHKTKIPKSLRACMSGGAPLAVQTIREFEQLFDTQISEGYGLTETTSAVCLNPSGPGYKEGSIGPAANSVEMRIVDDQGNPVTEGQEGEIVIRATVVTQGYWANAEATAEAIRDGWFYTGDIGYRDPDGYFFITDRKKDLIIRGGFNISPREVEEAIMTHPAVFDAAVVSVPDRREREAIKAFVVLKEGQTVAERDIVGYLAGNLAPYKVPKFIEFREALPKSMTGKVLRRELRLEEQAKADGGAHATGEQNGEFHEPAADPQTESEE